MNDNVIEVKRLVSLADALHYVQCIKDALNAEKLVFDFSELQYVKMLAVSIFARELRQAVSYRKGLGLLTFSKGHDNNKSVPLSYLSFIGFFDFIGLHDIGKKVRFEAEVACKNPYLAITKYCYTRFKSQAEVDYYRTEYDFIAEEALKIARLLEKQNDARNSLFSYSIREIMRNAYEHSGSVDFYVMGQTWRDGSAELVIMDDGCGIYKTLQSKYPLLKNQQEAIIESMKPGVSESDFTGNNKYNNSGFGLYVLSEFASRHGYISIASGDCLVTRDPSGIKTDSVWNDGTLVGIHLDSIPDDAQEEMSEIIKDGEKISANGTYPVHPSKHTWNLK